MPIAESYAVREIRSRTDDKIIQWRRSGDGRPLVAEHNGLTLGFSGGGETSLIRLKISAGIRGETVLIEPEPHHSRAPVGYVMRFVGLDPGEPDTPEKKEREDLRMELEALRSSIFAQLPKYGSDEHHRQQEEERQELLQQVVLGEQANTPR